MKRFKRNAEIEIVNHLCKNAPTTETLGAGAVWEKHTRKMVELLKLNLNESSAYKIEYSGSEFEEEDGWWIEYTTTLIPDSVIDDPNRPYIDFRRSIKLPSNTIFQDLHLMATMLRDDCQRAMKLVAKALRVDAIERGLAE